MKRFSILILVLLFASTSCARFRQNNQRNLFDNHKHDIKVTLYSGGKEVRIWDLKDAIISNSISSDGYYFYVKDQLVEISGDIVIEYLD